MKDWHLKLEWQQYVRQIFLMVARVKSYTVEYRQDLIAGVIPGEKRLLLNPALLPVPEQPVIPLRFLSTQPQLQLLKGLVAHEGGHVTLSAAKPEGEVGWLWNALEDERMERGVMRRFPELERDFGLLGDLMLEEGVRALQGRPYDLKNACLMWRFAHDRPDVPFLVTDPALWEAQICPLVEQSWHATADEVELLARQIWALLPREEQNTPPLLQIGADGAGESTTPGPAGGRQEGDASTDAPAGGQQTPDQAPEGNDTPGPGHAAAETPAESEDDTPEHLPGPPSDTGRGGTLQAQPEVLDTPEQTLVREVADLLAPRERPGRRVRSRSQGRYDFQRHQQGHERYFRKRGLPERPVPFFLRLLIDLSASMQGEKISGAKHLAQLLIQAGEQSRSHIEVWGFHNEAFLVSAQGDPDARAQVAQLGVGFGTRLGSALEETFHQTPALHGRQEIMVILSDGELTLTDRVRCEGLLQNEASDRLIVPLLLQGAEGSQDRWSALFGEAHCVTPAGLPDFLRGYLAELRADR